MLYLSVKDVWLGLGRNLLSVSFFFIWWNGWPKEKLIKMCTDSLRFRLSGLDAPILELSISLFFFSQMWQSSYQFLAWKLEKILPVVDLWSSNSKMMLLRLRGYDWSNPITLYLYSYFWETMTWQFRGLGLLSSKSYAEPIHLINTSLIVLFYII